MEKTYRCRGDRDAVISAVRVEAGLSHDCVTVWNRRGLAGSMMVNRGDGDVIARRLLPDDQLMKTANVGREG
jgi:hypothetical protein